MIIKNNTYNFSYKLSFKSSLDDEKSRLKSSLAKLKNDANYYQNLKTTETEEFKNKTEKLEYQILSARCNVNLVKQKIPLKQDDIKQVNSRIEAEKSKTNSLVEQVNSNNEQIQKHQNKQKEMFQENLKQTEILEENCAKKIASEAIYLNKIYNENLKKSKTCSKQQVIEALINPAIKFMDENENNLPSLILFENNNTGDEATALEKTMLEWIAKASGSNYAYINANEFNNNKNLIQLLKEISFQALKEYEKCGQCSYTMISNFDSIKPSEIRPEDISFLDKLFTEGSKLFNNTIIAVSNNFKNNEWFRSSSFKTIKFDKDFLMDELFGLPSIIKNLPKTQFSGQNLLKAIK